MKKFVGLLLLVAVVGVVAVLALRNRGAASGPSGGLLGGANTTLTATTVSGLIGGEKTNFLRDPEVVKILRDRYKLSVEASRRGSLEMVREEPPASRDFLWPSSQVALEIYKQTKRPLLRSDIIFNSPLVLYSWGKVTDALVKQNIVQKTNNAYYVVDFPKLVKLVNAEKQWKDIGLPQLYGRVVIYSTDPSLSNSGNMFAGLLANVVNNGSVVRETNLPAVLPTVRSFFDAQGYMEQSSDVIFTQFLNKGIGDKPLIVGYEAQMIEYSSASENAQRFASRKTEVRMLYPRPTVWSSHPLIALTPNGAKLAEALQDKDLQRIAWERHGFRSGIGVDNDVKKLKVGGIPDTIENVIPLPTPAVMERIVQGLGGK